MTTEKSTEIDQSIEQEAAEIVEELESEENRGSTDRQSDRLDARWDDPQPVHGRSPYGDPGDGSLSAHEVESDMDASRYGYTVDSATVVGEPAREDSPVDHERLQKLNAGRHPTDGSYSNRESGRHKLKVAESICSALDLNPAEQEGISRIMDALDLTRFGRVKAIEIVTLGVIRDWVTERRLEHTPDSVDPENIWISWTDEFQDMMEAHEISMSDLTTVKRVFREQYDLKARRSVYRGGPAPTVDPNLPRSSKPLSEQSEEVRTAFFENRQEKFEEKPDEYWENAPDEFVEMVPESFQYLLPDDYESGS